MSAPPSRRPLSRPTDSIVEFWGYSGALVFLLVIATASGVALRLILRGGSVAIPPHLRARAALVIGAVLLAVAEWLPVPGRAGIYIVGTALVVIGLLQNLDISGAAITAFGLGLTGFAVLVNGYLPLGVDAAEAAGISDGGLRQFSTDGTTLGILGDVVPIWPFVVSFGDLIAAAGAFIVARSLVRSPDVPGLAADEFLAEFTGSTNEPQIDLTRPPHKIDLRDDPPPPTIDDLHRDVRSLDE